MSDILSVLPKDLFVPRKVVSIINFGGRCRDYCHISVFSELMKDYVELVKSKDN